MEAELIIRGDIMEIAKFLDLTGRLEDLKGLLKQEPVSINPAGSVIPEPQPEEAREVPVNTRKCANPKCGNLFHPSRKDSMFCSKKCWMNNYWKHHKKPKKVNGKAVASVPESAVSKMTSPSCESCYHFERESRSSKAMCADCNENNKWEPDQN